MTTAVFDTNVLASGFAGFTKGTSTPGHLLRAWTNDAFQLFVSEHIYTELAHTLTKPYFAGRLTRVEVAAALALLRRRAVFIPITVQVQGVATHPADDLVLATAVSAQAHYLVTGDHALQQLGSYQGVTILSPRAFLEYLTRASAES